MKFECEQVNPFPQRNKYEEQMNPMHVFVYEAVLLM